MSRNTDMRDTEFEYKIVKEWVILSEIFNTGLFAKKFQIGNEEITLTYADVRTDYRYSLGWALLRERIMQLLHIRYCSHLG